MRLLGGLLCWITVVCTLSFFFMSIFDYYDAQHIKWIKQEIQLEEYKELDNMILNGFRDPCVTEYWNDHIITNGEWKIIQRVYNDWQVNKRKKIIDSRLKWNLAFIQKVNVLGWQNGNALVL